MVLLTVSTDRDPRPTQEPRHGPSWDGRVVEGRGMGRKGRDQGDGVPTVNRDFHLLCRDEYNGFRTGKLSTEEDIGVSVPRTHPT